MQVQHTRKWELLLSYVLFAVIAFFDAKMYFELAGSELLNILAFVLWSVSLDGSKIFLWLRFCGQKGVARWGYFTVALILAVVSMIGASGAALAISDGAKSSGYDEDPAYARAVAEYQAAEESYKSDLARKAALVAANRSVGDINRQLMLDEERLDALSEKLDKNEARGVTVSKTPNFDLVAGAARVPVQGLILWFMLLAALLLEVSAFLLSYHGTKVIAKQELRFLGNHLAKKTAQGYESLCGVIKAKEAATAIPVHTLCPSCAKVRILEEA